MSPLLLEVRDLTVCFDKAMVLSGVSLQVGHGELVSLVGPNGAGKTTLLRTLCGLVRWEQNVWRGTRAGEITIEGHVRFNGERIDHLLPHAIARKGLVLCPERSRPFREMTVLENLMAGAYLVQDRATVRARLQTVYELFPVLRDRAHQVAGTLSGGEQQMLAIGRALMQQPALLCIDEPSTGLAPRAKQLLFDKIREIKQMGLTVLLVEQDVAMAFSLANRSYILSHGRVVAEGTSEQLLQDPITRRSYLGL